MPEYRRFIAYFYEYINGKKQKNAGYAKVELRNGMWRILFRLTSDHQPQPPIQVYGFVRESGYLLGFLLGTMRPGQEISEEWAYRSEAPIGKDRYRLEDLAGIWIQSGEDRTFLTVWDDDTVDPEKFVLELPSPEAVGSRERPQARPDEMRAIAPGEAGTMQSLPVNTGSGGESGPTGEDDTVQSPPEAQANELQGFPAAGDQTEQSLLSNGASEIEDFSAAAENEKQSQLSDGANEPYSDPAAGDKDGQSFLSNGASEIEDFSIAAESEKQSQSAARAAELHSYPAAGDQTEQSLLSNGASEMEGFSAAAENEKQSQPASEADKAENETQSQPSDEADKAENEKQSQPSDGANELQSFPAAGDINDGPGARAECGEQSLCGKAGSKDGICQANAGARERGNAGAAAQTPDVMKELFGKRTRFQPFADNEITDCIMIMPCDIIRLQQGRWKVGRSSFLQHGFYQHRHLLLGRMSDGAYVLGVPGIFNPQEQYMAQMFGFVHFKLSRVCQKGRRYGYWYRVLEEE